MKSIKEGKGITAANDGREMRPPTKKDEGEGQYQLRILDKEFIEKRRLLVCGTGRK
jgi:hypothetical protein